MDLTLPVEDRIDAYDMKFFEVQDRMEASDDMKFKENSP